MSTITRHMSRKNLRVLDINKQKDIQDFYLFKNKNKQGDGVASVHFINNGRKILIKLSDGQCWIPAYIIQYVWYQDGNNGAYQ